MSKYSTAKSGYTLLFLLLIMVSLICTCGKNNEGPIKIAAVMPLTGEGAVYGVPQKNAAELAAKTLNDNGGVLGRAIEIISYDDKALASEAANIAKMVTSRKDIIGIIGHPNSGNAIAASKIYNESNLPYIATSPANPVLTQQGFQNVFRFAPTDDMQGFSSAEFVYNKLKIKSAVVFHDNASYGKGLADNFSKRYQELGGKIPMLEGLIPGQNDYRSILLKAKKHNPSVIFFGGMLTEGSIIIRQAKEINFEVKFVFGDGCFDERLKELSGTECNNVFISFLAPPWSEIPSAKDFVDKYNNTYGSLPPFAPYGYDAIMVLAKGIMLANSTNNVKVIAALRGENFGIEGITGPIMFNNNNQTTNRRFYFYRFNEYGKLIMYQ